MKTSLAAVLSLIVTTSLSAGLTRFKDWSSSPQAYFMTSAERAEWSAVKTDEDAQKFVDAFLARRGGAAFAAEVDKRAAMADKYLTVGKTPGSKTLRGKVIILLGPPAAMDVALAEQSSRRFDRSAAIMKGESGDAGRGAGTAAGAVATTDSAMVSGSAKRLYTFTFRGDAAKLVSKDEVTLFVEADPNTGKDRFSSGGADSEKLLEAAASASIKKP